MMSSSKNMRICVFVENRGVFHVDFSCRVWPPSKALLRFLTSHIPGFTYESLNNIHNFTRCAFYSDVFSTRHYAKESVHFHRILYDQKYANKVSVIKGTSLVP